MTPERERMFREQVDVPTDSLDVKMWQEAVRDVFQALDTERIATATTDAIAHRFAQELIVERDTTHKWIERDYASTERAEKAEETLDVERAKVAALREALCEMTVKWSGGNG